MPHVIDDSPAANGATAIDAGDMDNDGDMDLVCASNVADQYHWYENDGDENFTLHLIDSSSYADGPRGLTLTDLDKDMDLDVIVASLGQDSFAWYENDGSGNFSPHLISNVPTYTDGAFAVVAADIDGDTIDDIVGAANITDAFSWFNTVGVVLSTSENMISEIVLYPNPSSDIINLKAYATIENIEIYSMLGQKVLSKTINASTSELDISFLQSGNYVLLVTSANETGVYKFIKQ